MFRAACVRVLQTEGAIQVIELESLHKEKVTTVLELLLAEENAARMGQEKPQERPTPDTSSHAPGSIELTASGCSGADQQV